ncbi:helix-turn-helix domain-containing protein [Methylocystis sp. WRRC1]|uniref:sigma factor-like helix-turn-helix DNA-binding protein n=1 Tax=Methylocystis sp. WRRC1 TaxID=1732014 RepID=UPI001D15718B|nr:helix-turn-helix domain-containing protein [Methylocystis sp. WRRC1]
MSTAEKIRELADNGLTASQISRELGISRQRVSQIAKREGIKTVPWVYSAPPRPRVKTGGVDIEITRRAAGSIAELLVAADLTARGHLVYMPIKWSRGHDLISLKNGILRTFEVKCGTRLTSGRLSFDKKNAANSDHYAVVLTGEVVSYDPPIDE